MRAVAACVIALVASVLAGGCDDAGGGEQAPARAGVDRPPPLTTADRQAIRDTVADARAALATRDADRLCALLTREGKAIVGAVDGRPARQCATSAATLIRRLRDDAGSAADRRAPVVAVRGTANRGAALVRLSGGQPLDVPLVRERGRWKLGGLLSPSLSSIQADALAGAASPRARRPPSLRSTTAPGDPVTVWYFANGAATRCAGVEPIGLTGPGGTTIHGGCGFDLAADARLVVRSPFGRLEIARCTVRYRVIADGRGRTWAEEPSFWGGRECSDVSECFGPGTVRLMPGRIGLAPDGSFRHRTSGMCLDTDVGRFRGPLTLPLTRARPRARPDARAAVGTTGVSFDGVWKMTPGHVRLTGAGDPPPRS